ncbi:MAG: HAMP domain-containing histidine kinase [Phycisphaerales bacterium]|nr:HAMP domain-containing histidine kinase [Phycisphaerales bacterium]
MTHDNTNDQNQNPSPEKKAVSPPTRSKKLLPPNDPSAGPEAADQLTTLAHDLSNLIDGSMRWLSIAATGINSDQPDPNEQLETARQQIDTVQATLHRMSTMVNVAMRSHTVPIGSPLLGVSTAITTAMTIDHAVDVVAPLAAQAGVRIEVNINQDAGNLPAGPIYTVILNALFNAVESISGATKADSLDPGGLIQIEATLDQKHDELVITITDDGIGLKPGTNPEQPFKHGYTTNNSNNESDKLWGVGLSISHQIIEQLEGIITLTNRPPNPDQSISSRPGAILTARVPIPHQDDNPGDQTIG